MSESNRALSEALEEWEQALSALQKSFQQSPGKSSENDGTVSADRREKSAIQRQSRQDVKSCSFRNGKSKPKPVQRRSTQRRKRQQQQKEAIEALLDRLHIPIWITFVPIMLLVFASKSGSTLGIVGAIALGVIALPVAVFVFFAHHWIIAKFEAIKASWIGTETKWKARAEAQRGRQELEAKLKNKEAARHEIERAMNAKKALELESDVRAIDRSAASCTHLNKLKTERDLAELRQSHEDLVLSDAEIEGFISEIDAIEDPRIKAAVIEEFLAEA